MLWIKRLLVLLTVLLVAGVTLIFVLENQGVAQLQFMSIQSPELPVALFITAAFVAGGVLGIGFSLYHIAHLRFALARRRRELTLCRQELEKVRAQSVAVQASS